MNEGENAVFTCQVSGNNIQTVKWYYKKQTLSDSLQIESSNGNSRTNTLKLSTVTASNTGVYECQVTAWDAFYNGYASKTAELFVVGKEVPLLIVHISTYTQVNSCKSVS